MDRIESNIRLAKKIMKILSIDYRFDWEIYEDILSRNLLKCKSWLDIGCGENQIVNSFNVRYKIGVDKKLPESGESRKNFCCASVYRLPFKSDSFDIITAKFFIEHLRTPSEAFDEIRKVLKVGGLFIIHTTNKFSPVIMIKNLLPRRLLLRVLSVLAGIKEIHPCYYKFNSPKEFKRGISGFTKIKEFYICNIFIFIRPVMLIDILLYLLTSRLKLYKVCPVYCAILKKVN